MPVTENYRREAFLKGLAGALFVVVAFLRTGWDWRAWVPLLTGVLYLFLAYRTIQLGRRAYPDR